MLVWWKTISALGKDAMGLLNHEKLVISMVVKRYAVIPASFCFSQTMSSSIKKLIFTDFFCCIGVKISAYQIKSLRKTFSKNILPFE